MQVIIAEKPSVAREIAAIVGATNRKDGFIEENGYAVGRPGCREAARYSPGIVRHGRAHHRRDRRGA